VFGLKFTNPVGLAAGFDKNGEFISEMANLGFGFIEVGTVNPFRSPATPNRVCSAVWPIRLLLIAWGLII